MVVAIIWWTKVRLCCFQLSIFLKQAPSSVLSGMLYRKNYPESKYIENKHCTIKEMSSNCKDCLFQKIGYVAVCFNDYH